MPRPNSWYVITGGPSVGKTTLLAELERLGYAVIPEAARVVIDEAVARGITPKELRADEKRFQEDIARLKEKIEATHDPNQPTFFDRGMQDTTAYMRYYGYAMAPWMVKLCENACYQQVFLLDSLPRFERDYARTEETAFAGRIQQLLFEAYAERGMEAVRVPAMSVDERVKFVLSHITQEQLA